MSEKQKLDETKDCYKNILEALIKEIDMCNKASNIGSMGNMTCATKAQAMLRFDYVKCNKESKIDLCPNYATRKLSKKRRRNLNMNKIRRI